MKSILWYFTFVLILSSFFVFFLNPFSLISLADETAIPQPGKQVAQKVELPVSTNVWGDGARNLRERAASAPLDDTKKEEVQFWLFLPQDYDAQSTTQSWPLILFLHGAGERGDLVDKVLVHGPPKLLKEETYREKCPFIVVSPQCRDRRSWSPKQLLALIDTLEKEYKVDKKRIYATGLSMGGFGSWALAAEAPTRFAAVAPICGGSRIEEAAKLVDIPIWAFHGEKDSVVPVHLSRDMVAAVEVAGGKKIKLTLYPEADHDSWTQTYNNEELYKWFLNHTNER